MTRGVKNLTLMPNRKLDREQLTGLAAGLFVLCLHVHELTEAEKNLKKT